MNIASNRMKMVTLHNRNYFKITNNIIVWQKGTLIICKHKARKNKKILSFTNF